MSGEVVLTPGASAEPETCGSCKFFERKAYEERTSFYGFCRIKLPGKFPERSAYRMIDPAQRDREFTGNEDQIRDTDRCDLHRPDGRVYIVQRRVGGP